MKLTEREQQLKAMREARYGRSPAVEAIPAMRKYNKAPEAEKVRASVALVEAREGYVCPICEARRAKEAARKRRYRERHGEKK